MLTNKELLRPKMQLLETFIVRNLPMSRRMAGVSLIAISALLFSTRYLSAAIFGSGVSSWNSKLFQAMLTYVGNELVTLSGMALIGGILYLVWAELDHRKGRDE